MPPHPTVAFNAAQLWPGWLVAHSPGGGMPRVKLGMLAAAVLKACASPIGLTQGFVDEPDRCDFDPDAVLCMDGGALHCLTAAQVEAMRGI